MEEIHKMDLVRDSNDEWEFECDTCGRTLILQKNPPKFRVVVKGNQTIRHYGSIGIGNSLNLTVGANVV